MQILKKPTNVFGHSFYSSSQYTVDDEIQLEKTDKERENTVKKRKRTFKLITFIYTLKGKKKTSCAFPNANFTPITPGCQKSHNRRHSETSMKVISEQASTFLPNDPIHTAVCGGKEPLREEALIIGTQCPEGPRSSKHTHPSALTLL